MVRSAHPQGKKRAREREEVRLTRGWKEPRARDIYSVCRGIVAVVVVVVDGGGSGGDGDGGGSGRR